MKASTRKSLISRSGSMGRAIGDSLGAVGKLFDCIADLVITRDEESKADRIQTIHDAKRAAYEAKKKLEKARKGSDGVIEIVKKAEKELKEEE